MLIVCPLSVVPHWRRTIEADAPGHSVLVVTDKDRTTIAVYDKADRQVYGLEVAARNGSGVATLYAVTRFVYDANGNLVQSIAYAKTMALADYDIATIDTAVAANLGALDAGMASVYDALGRKVYGVQVAARDSSGAPTQYAVVKYDYDALRETAEALSRVTELLARHLPGDARVTSVWLGLAGAIPATLAGAQRLTSTSVKAPLPHPTSSHLRPAGMPSHERNRGATRRLHRPTYCS